jgi:hypothetical protein
MIYHTYNEYKAACQTVDKMLNNPNRSGNDTKELLLMLERIKLTEQAGIYG